MKYQVYIKKEIKSEADVPKVDDLYFVHSKNSGKQTKFSFHENAHVWMKNIDYYLIFINQVKNHNSLAFLKLSSYLRTMKTIYNFIILLKWTRYWKNEIHPTYWSYIRHAWKLAKEITKED